MENSNEIVVLKKGHDKTKFPYHPCKLPKRKERKRLGLEYGAVIECRVCGRQWEWVEDWGGPGGYWMPLVLPYNPPEEA